MLLCALQVFLAVMDLTGVLLIGVVAALGAASFSAGDMPKMGSSIGWLDSFSGGAEQTTALLAVLAGTLLITKSVLSFLLIRRSYRFLANRQAMISSRLAELLLSRPLLDVQRRSSQETAFMLTSGVNAVTIGVLGAAVVIFAELSMMLIMGIGLLAVDFALALFTALFFGVIALSLNATLGGWARRLGSRLTQAEILSTTSLHEALKAYREVTVSGRRGFFISRFEDLRWRAASVQSDLQVMSQVAKYIFEVALVVGGSTLIVSQLSTKDIAAAVGTLAVFVAAASRIMPSLLRMQQAALGIRVAAASAEPTFQLSRELSTGPSPAPVDLQITHRLISGLKTGHSGFIPGLTVENVSLTYPGASRCSVWEISLTVHPGKSLAIVGPTGAGKSTLADLILGVLEPDAGRVELGGLKPTEAVLRWPGAISYVPQEVSIVNGSIRENVALGLPEALVNDEEVWEALVKAHLADYLAKERDSLSTVVGEHGVRLSGGQRQRLGLARALYTKPRLIVLDEATSALDAETEFGVSQALRDLEGSVSLVLVAHRLATVRTCSQIAYMENGRVIAVGDFEAVRSQHPNFDRQARLLGL